MSNMYEMAKLGQTSGNPYLAPVQGGLNGPVQQRSCTDLFCCILFLLCFLAFFGVSGYGIYKGNPSAVLGIYSYDKVLCSNQTQYAFMPNLLQSTPDISVACLSSCPKVNESLNNCTGWSAYCNNATAPVANYSTILIGDVYCSPDPNELTTKVSQVTGVSSLSQSVEDIKNSKYVLIGAVVAAFILGIIYFVFLRFCAGVVIWLSLVFFVLAMIAIGVYMFLFTQGIQLIKVPFDLSTANKDSMRIASYVLWSVSVLVIILVVVLYKTIKLAIGVIKCTAIYIADTCHIVFFPIVMAIFLICMIAIFLVSLTFVYSMGSPILDNGYPFATLMPDTLTIVLLAVAAFTGLWILLQINGTTNFILSSSATIWYFSNSSLGQTPHRPVTTSISRAFRYHPGTIAFASLVLALFFVIRLLSSIFKSNPNSVGANRFVQCCVKCLTCFGSIFNICMRFLTKGAYVQCALNGTNYCVSSMEAFKLIAGNPVRMALTTGLSSMVNLLGKLAITFIVLIAAYYSMMSIEYFSIMVKNPVPPTVICGLIAFAISSLYMSVYGTSCNAIIQCFLMDELDAKTRGQRARYCPGPLREIIDDNTYVD